MNEVKIIDPKEFGLTDENALQVQESFIPVIAERESLTLLYVELLDEEMTPELAKKAGLLRKKFVKNRTGTVKIHKVEKAFALAYGKLCDAFKNKNIVPVELMESRLYELENFYVIQEQLRISELQNVRANEVHQYLLPDNIAEISDELGKMPDFVWNTFIYGMKTNFENYIEEEKQKEVKLIEVKKQAEIEEGKRKLEKTRRFKTSKLSHLIPDYDTIVFAEMSEITFKSLVDAAIELRTLAEKKQKEIEAENANLKLQAEHDKKAQQIELAKIRKVQQEKDAKEKTRLAKLQEIEDAKQTKLQQEKAALEKEIYDRKLAEITAKKQAEEAKQAELNKGDADKKSDLVDDLLQIIDKFKFESAANKAMFIQVRDDITDVIHLIQE